MIEIERVLFEISKIAFRKFKFKIRKKVIEKLQFLKLDNPSN